MRKILMVLIVAALLFASSPAFATHDEATDMAIDTLILRPLGIVSILTGTGLYLLSYPFASMTNSLDKTGEALVMEPYRYTFERPVGEIEYELD